MIIQKIVTQDHPEDTEYTVIVSTDSVIERDIILKYLSQAEEEYKAWIKHFTKNLSQANKGLKTWKKECSKGE